LDVLGGITLSKDRPEIAVDWSGPLGQVKNHRASDFFMNPCECLVGNEHLGFEVQHHDGLYGEKTGPVGFAFADAMTKQGHGFNNMQAVVAPNLAPPIRTVMITKVKTDSLQRAVQLWGAAQEGIARAVCDAYEHEWFPAGAETKHVLVVGVFIHPFAGLAPQEDGKFDPKKFLTDDALEGSMYGIYGLNYLCTLGLLADALTGGLTPAERVERAKTAKHPFRGFNEVKVAS
jgi:5,6,7,8-tetrahydromethanopterin hydro-lyase